MEITGKKSVELYLTGWQMRMVMDLLGAEAQARLIPTESGPVLRCIGPAAHSTQTKSKRMYLTGQQRKELKSAIGTDCTFVEIVAEPTKRSPPVIRAA
jgi:hypothetical protein